MAGVKGRSGGARPGAGRPKGGSKAKAAELAALAALAADAAGVAGGSTAGATASATGAGDQQGGAQPVALDSLGYLRQAINDPKLDPASKVRAAIALAAYEHQKLAEGGIKPQRANAAGVAAAGKFAPRPAPMRLVKG